MSNKRLTLLQMKKVGLKLSLVVSVILIATASNCKKHPKPQKYLGTFPLGNIKDYLYFKPGSMWVYMCDSTGQLDTQVLNSIDTSWIIKSYVKYQLLSRVIKSRNEGSTYNDRQPGGDFYYNENYSYFWSITRNRSNPNDSRGGTDCIFFKPYDTNSLGGFGSSETHYKGILTNYTVLGHTYDTIRVYQVQYSSGWPKVNSWRLPYLDYTAGMIYYIAKGVGIVQLKVLAWDYVHQQKFTHNWNLKEYKIIP